MSGELRECPFCGSMDSFELSRLTFSGVTHHWISCPDCGASGPPTFSELEAVQAWGERINEFTVTDAGRAMLKDGES